MLIISGICELPSYENFFVYEKTKGIYFILVRLTNKKADLNNELK